MQARIKVFWSSAQGFREGFHFRWYSVHWEGVFAFPLLKRVIQQVRRAYKRVPTLPMPAFPNFFSRFLDRKIVIDILSYVILNNTQVIDKRFLLVWYRRKFLDYFFQVYRLCFSQKGEYQSKIMLTIIYVHIEVCYCLCKCTIKFSLWLKNRSFHQIKHFVST